MSLSIYMLTANCFQILLSQMGFNMLLAIFFLSGPKGDWLNIHMRLYLIDWLYV